MNTILDILELRKIRLEYTSPPICGLIFSGSSSGSFSLIEANVVPDRAGIAAPANPTITQSPTLGGCPIISFSAPRGQLGFLIYLENPPGSGTYGLVSNTIPPGAIGIITAGNYFTAPVDQFGVEGPHSGPTVVPGGVYTPVFVVTSPTAVSYNIYNGTTLVWSGINPSRNAFEGCSCANYEVQALSLEGTALSAPVHACAPALMSVTPASITFSNIVIGTSNQQSFTLKNIGPVAIQGSSLFSLTDCSIVAGASYTIFPGQTQLVTIQFSPNALENLSGTITFTGANSLSGQVNASSTCASNSPLSPAALSGTPGILALDPLDRYVWIHNTTQTLWGIDMRTNTIVQTVANTGMGGQFVDIVYNPKYGTKGGMILSGTANTTRKIIDLSNFSLVSSSNMPFATNSYCNGVRPSDGMMCGVQQTNTGVFVVDKTFATLLNTTFAGKSFGGCCYSSLTDKFLLASQGAGQSYWILDPNNLAGGIVAGGGNTPGGNSCFAEVPVLKYIFMSGTTGWSFINPMTNTVLASGNTTITNATGVTYSPCSGFIYVACNGTNVRVNPNTFALTSVGPGANYRGIVYDLLSNLEFATDATNTRAVSLSL